MKRVLIYLTLIISLAVLFAQKPPYNGSKSYVEGQVMVKLRSDVSRAQEASGLQELLNECMNINLQFEERLSGRLNIVLLSFHPGRLPDDQVLKQIKASPDVEMVQFNHFIKSRDLIPSDQYFELQWNMNNTGQTGGTPDADIDGPEAWGIGTSGITATGDTIVIAIVDDGFDINHEDLKFWKNYHEIPNNSIDDDTNGYIDDYDGWNSWSNSGEIIERDHGTHVTGIACAQGDNDRGVTGVNLHVKAMPVVGSATVESIVVAAYSYVYEMRSEYNESGGESGAFVVATNSSFGIDLGQPEDYPIWGAMYDSMGAIGILSAAATANANYNIDEVGDIPTAFPSDWLITVTNTNQDDEKYNGAGYGLTTIDLGAPGTQIYSTRQNNQYGYKTGCSMASPHVAGAVAYLYSVADQGFMQLVHNNPGGMALTIKQCILQGVDTLPSLEGITVSGGRLNIYKAALLLPTNELSVSIAQEQDSICPGDTVQMAAMVLGGTGNLTYSWTSMPEGFTSTDSAISVSPAVSTIYYLTVSDENDSTVSDSAQINVKSLPPQPSILTGPASVDNLFIAYSVYTCSEVENAVSYSWMIEPEDAASIGITGTEAHILWENTFTGIASITVVALNDCGPGEVSDTFVTEVYTSAGLKENDAETQFNLWPNPASSVLRVEVSGLNLGTAYSVVIRDVAGKFIFETNLTDNSGELLINTTQFKPGIYIVSLVSNKDIKASKKLLITE